MINTKECRSLIIAMFVINNFTNDARVRREAGTLADRGHKVTVIALKDTETQGKETIDNFQVQRINVYTRSLPKIPGLQAVKYFEFIIRSVIIAARMRAQVCHGHDLNALVPAYIASVLLRALVIYDSHELATGQNVLRKRFKWEASIWQGFESFLIKRAHLVITVSPDIAKELARLYSIKLPEVIMNCPPFEAVPRNNLLRKEFNLQQFDTIVIYQGVFARNRGLEVLVDSFKYLADRYKLILMGPESPHKEIIKERAGKLGLSGRVYFRKAVPVEQVVTYVASADVGTFLSNPVIKSQRLGLPNKLFECMAAGTPIVVGTICGELVEQLGVGVKCDQNDPSSLADAIIRLTNDNCFYQQVQVKAREQARREYNWQVQGEKLASLYKRLAQNHLQEKSIS